MLQSDPMLQTSPIQQACSSVGSAASLARALSVTPSMVTQWTRGIRGIPADRCPAIERATSGAVTAEVLRPDVAWSRIPDPSWPHPAGRPVIDVARLLAVAQEG